MVEYRADTELLLSLSYQLIDREIEYRQCAGDINLLISEKAEWEEKTWVDLMPAWAWVMAVSLLLSAVGVGIVIGVQLGI